MVWGLDCDAYVSPNPALRFCFGVTTAFRYGKLSRCVLDVLGANIGTNALGKECLCYKPFEQHAWAVC